MISSTVAWAWGLGAIGATLGLWGLRALFRPTTGALDLQRVSLDVVAERLGLEGERDGPVKGDWGGRPTVLFRSGTDLVVRMVAEGGHWSFRSGAQGEPSGDDAFDAVFDVDWDATDAWRLTTTARDHLLGLTRVGAVAGMGRWLEVRIPDDAALDVDAVEEQLRALGATLGAMAAATPAGTASEPSEPAAVRERSFDRAEAAADDLAPFRSSELVRPRFHAALAWGDDAALVDVLADPQLPDAFARRGMAALSEDAVLEAVPRLLASASPGVRQRGAWLARSHPSQAMTERTVAWWATGQHPVVAWHEAEERDLVASYLVDSWAAAAPERALEAWSEVLMLPLLTPSQKRVMEVLARVAPVEFVPRLKELQPRLPTAMRRRVDRTVAAIQERSGGAEGRMALVDPGAQQGALSVADDERQRMGRLSRATTEPPSRS